MKLGFSLSNNQGIEDVQAIVRLAVRAEELGFASVWASDHLFNVRYVFERIGDRPYHDPLTILTYVAAVTRRIRLGTSVLVLPYHHPMRLAKAAATLDVLSGGRLVLGVGVGAVEEEFEAVGASYANRGPYTDEAIAVMKALWTEPRPSHEGRVYRFSGMPFSPKPVQKPHIPLVIGGVSRAAIRRAVRAGNGWHALPMSPDALRDGMRYLAEQAEAAGRPVKDIPVSLSIPIQGGRAGRFTLGTEPAGIVKNLQAFASLGVDTVVISPPTGDPSATMPALEMIARDVMPALA